MRLSSIARLYRVRIRARLTQELFAVLGIAIGVSLLFSSQVANTSLNGSVERLTNGIVGQMRFQIAARDNRGFDERLLGEVLRLPGVQAAAPVLEQDANVIGPSGRQSVDLVGTDPRQARLGGSIARQVNPLALGDARVLTMTPELARRIGVDSIRSVRVQLGAKTVTALLVPDSLGARASELGESPIALAPLRAVQVLTGMNRRLSSVFVRCSRAHDQLVEAGLRRLAAGRLNVTSADFTSELFRRAAGPVDQSTGLFAALSALVGFLFAFNALLLTVPQRRNLIQDLRLDGYTRQMIIEVLVLDALVLGILASGLGLVLGELLSSAVFDSNPGYLSFAFPVGSQRIVSWESIAIAAGGGMLAATGGVLVPLARELFGFRAVAGPAPSRASGARPWWLLLASVAFLLATTLILLLETQSAIAGVVSLTLALLLCLPAFIELAVRAGDRLRALLSSAAFYLALIELRPRSNRTRSLAIAATGAIAVFGSVSIEGARENLQRGLRASARATDSRADIWITPGGASNVLATTPFEDVAGTMLARLHGVRAVRRYRGSFFDWGPRRVWIIAQPRSDLHPVAPSQLVRGDAALASSRLRAHGWAVVSQAIASEYHLHLGQEFTLPSARPMRFRVAALSTNLGWPPGAVILNADDYALAWGNADLSAYQLELDAGAAPLVVSQRARQALGSQTGLRVETARQRERRQYATAGQALSRLTQIRSLVLIAAVLAMASAMGAMIWQRKARLADMKVDGFSRLVLWRALLWESGILLGTGCAVGALFGLYGQLLLTRALSVVTGFPTLESTPWLGAIGNFALITAVAVAIVALPGYGAARVRPSVGMQE